MSATTHIPGNLVRQLRQRIDRLTTAVVRARSARRIAAGRRNAGASSLAGATMDERLHREWRHVGALAVTVAPRHSSGLSTSWATSDTAENHVFNTVRTDPIQAKLAIDGSQPGKATAPRVRLAAALLTRAAELQRAARQLVGDGRAA